MDDFMLMDQENESLRDQIEFAEREFSQTHGEFYNLAQDKMMVDSEFDDFRSEAESEIAHLNEVVIQKRDQLDKLMRQVMQTHTSGFGNGSMHN
jgi:hypothetical protein